jgi:hypothetical protein
MTRTTSRFALAAVLTALTVPAFASAESSISGDPTWPAIENPAPAVALRAQGGEAQALLASDPTFPLTDSAAPAIALVAIPDDGGPQADPVEEWEPTPNVAIALSASKVERVATVR